MTSGRIITSEFLPPSIKAKQKQPVPTDPTSTKSTLGDQIDEYRLRRLLQECEYNRSRVAQELGISRSSLYRLLNKYSII